MTLINLFVSLVIREAMFLLLKYVSRFSPILFENIVAILIDTCIFYTLSGVFK